MAPQAYLQMHNLLSRRKQTIHENFERIKAICQSLATSMNRLSHLQNVERQQPASSSRIQEDSLTEPLFYDQPNDVVQQISSRDDDLPLSDHNTLRHPNGTGNIETDDQDHEADLPSEFASATLPKLRLAEDMINSIQKQDSRKTFVIQLLSRIYEIQTLQLSK
ncbi:hypothetical protein AMATHDRAFT_50472 [Amanita thiersii Skay4041]|uniref:Uncharacterized protein n=1 Tax=Amanita thiersii Skay4041 TaxID=703135 RepID=A0A2A9NHT0_9AGAR|nr:hypothetical protein AMATHDRAFT_50472 [Amanita thiersii Skay4041]